MHITDRRRGNVRLGWPIAASFAFSAVIALCAVGLEMISSGPAVSGRITVLTEAEAMSTVTLTKTWQNDDAGTVEVKTVQNPGETLADLKARHKAAVDAAMAEFPETA